MDPLEDDNDNNEDCEFPTYEYCCSRRYAGRHVIQPMFAVEKKLEKSALKSDGITSEKRYVCLLCAETCYDRTKARPIVCYREMTCGCDCRHGAKGISAFEKDKRYITLEIVKRDGMVGINSALTNAIYTAHTQLELARSFPAAPSEMQALTEQLGPSSDDLRHLIVKAQRLSTETFGDYLCPGAVVGGRIASAFLGLNYKSRVAVEVPLTSKPIDGKMCRWFCQVFDPTTQMWVNVVPTSHSVNDPASMSKVSVTLSVNEGGFITAVNVSALSVEVVEALARKLLRFEVLQRELNGHSADDYSTSRENMMLLYVAMGKLVTKHLSEVKRTPEDIVKDLEETYVQLSSVERRTAVDPTSYDDTLKAVKDMLDNDNDSCGVLVRWMVEWSDFDLITVAEFLRLVVDAWASSQNSETLAMRMKNINFVGTLKALLSRTSHVATGAQLVVLDIVRELYEKHTYALLTVGLWEDLLRALGDIVWHEERRSCGVTWSKPVAFLVSYVAWIAVRSLWLLRESNPTFPSSLLDGASVTAARSLGQLLQLDDPAVTLSIITAAEILNGRFEACRDTLITNVLPKLDALPHRPEGRTAWMAELRNPS